MLNQWDFPYIPTDDPEVDITPPGASSTGMVPDNQGHTTQSAKALLTAPTPEESTTGVLSRNEAIAQKVQEKQQRLGKTGNVGPSLNGIPYVLLGENDKKVAIELYQIKEASDTARQEQAVRERTAYVTDRGLDTFVGGVVNVLAKFKAGTTTLAGQAVATPIVVANAYNRSGLTKKDFKTYQVILEKERTGIALTPEELLHKEKEINTNYQGGKYETKSKYERIVDLQAGQMMLESIDSIAIDYNKTTNTKLTDIALAEVTDSAAQASKEIFEDGDILKGTWTALKGLGQLVVENPQATVELTAEILPTMFALATKAAIAAPVLMASEYESAINEFTEEYDRPPDAAESAVAGLLVAGAVLLDTFGAKASLAGKKVVEGIANTAKKLGIKIPKNTLERVKEGTQAKSKSKLKKALGITIGITKRAAKPVGKVGAVAAIEGATEGAQSVLTQYAGVQDIDKISPEEVIVDTIVGSAVGGAIKATTTTATSIPKAITTTKETVGEVAANRAEVLVSEGIGNPDEVVAAATKNNRPDIAIKALQDVDLSKMSQEEKINHLVELKKQVSIFATQGTGKSIEETQEHIRQLEEYERDLAEAVKKVHTTKTDVPLKEEIGQETPSPVTEAKQGSPVVQATIGRDVAAGVLTPKQVERVFGSTAFEDLSSTDKKIITDYQALQEAQNKLDTATEVVEASPSAEQVHTQVLNGGEGFIGVNKHIENVQQALALGDQELVQDTLDALTVFKQTRLDKLDSKHPSGTYITPQGKKRAHSLQVKNLILEEVSTINAAVTHINNIITTLGTSPQTEAVKPEAVEGVPSEPKVKEATKPSTVPNSEVEVTDNPTQNISEETATRSLSIAEQIKTQLAENTPGTPKIKTQSKKKSKKKAEPQYRSNIKGALAILRECGV